MTTRDEVLNDPEWRELTKQLVASMMMEKIKSLDESDFDELMLDPARDRHTLQDLRSIAGDLVPLASYVALGILEGLMDEAEKWRSRT